MKEQIILNIFYIKCVFIRLILFCKMLLWVSPEELRGTEEMKQQTVTLDEERWEPAKADQLRSKSLTQQSGSLPVKPALAWLWLLIWIITVTGRKAVIRKKEGVWMFLWES